MNYETIKWQHDVHLIFHCEYCDFLLVIQPILNSICLTSCTSYNVVYEFMFHSRIFEY